MLIFFPETNFANCDATFGTSCYQLKRTTVDWQTALNSCQQDGGHLIDVLSVDENNAMKSIIQTITAGINSMHAAHVLVV